MKGLDARQNGQGEEDSDRKTNAPALKAKPRRKKRVRGEKPRERTVLRQYERPAEVRLGRGRTRALDVAPTRTAETAVPRRLRALLAAKTWVEQRADGGKSSITRIGVRDASVAEKSDRKEITQSGALILNGKPGKQSEPSRRMTRNEILIQHVRKNSHQVEKKRTYYAKKAERAVLRQERRKRRRSGHESDSCDAEESEIDKATHEKRPRFGEQAQAPPRLVPVAKRGQSQGVIPEP